MPARRVGKGKAAEAAFPSYCSMAQRLGMYRRAVAASNPPVSPQHIQAIKRPTLNQCLTVSIDKDSIEAGFHTKGKKNGVVSTPVHMGYIENKPDSVLTPQYL